MLSILKRAVRNILEKRSPDLVMLYKDIVQLRKRRKQHFEMTAYGFEIIGNDLMSQNSFETEETALVIDLFKQTNIDVVVDIGANIGYYTCLALSLNKPVVAIEPLPNNLKYLYANLARNRWDRLEVFPLGLSSAPGITRIYSDGTGASLIKGWGNDDSELYNSISVSTLDIVLSDRFVDKKLFIKMDVEGFEFPVLSGALKTLTRTIAPVWMLEICLCEHHPDGINPDFEKIFNLFWEYGYSAFTAEKSQRQISPNDIQQWIRNKKVDRGVLNFIFSKK